MTVILDTGPLVALQSARDKHHTWCLEAFGSIRGPLVTCEAVLTEVSFLLRQSPTAFDLVLGQVTRGTIRVEPMTAHASELRSLMKKYRSVPMSYADACLVRLAERFSEARVLTLDRDFDTYRRHGRQVISLLAPFRDA